MTDAEKEMLGLLGDLVRETKRMADLVDQMSARLERSAQVRVHVNGEVPTPPNPNPRCPKCNIELSPVMGYVCSQGGNCPTGLGGMSCMATDGISRNA